MSDNVQVAVRVRPFNKREISLGEDKCIIRMNGPTTTIIDEKGGERSFTFDYSFDSFDSNSPNFASQDDVHQTLGVGVLDNAWQGYNCSLFAYGQTGSGKSYSMFGVNDPPEDAGIVPRVCKEIFRRMEENEDENLKFEVEIAMLEIYMEKLRDLLNPKSGGLQISRVPSIGTIVKGLVGIPVTNYAEIEELYQQGDSMRTTAATKMNANSSRAHTVFQIRFKQVRAVTLGEKNIEQVKESQINLIDLAGSERVSKSGATGQTLKEGQEINKSLSTLGRVIETLAKQATSKSTLYVPYRDSKLTMLLQDALGGNSRTVMICAVSPAMNNYDESLSTLRYADRAKQIKNKAVVNEDPAAKKIRELEEEVKKLRELVGTDGVPGDSSLRSDQIEMLNNQLKQAEEFIAQLSMENEEKKRIAEEKKKLREEAIADSGISLGEVGMVFGLDTNEVSRLVNLSQDPHFNENLVYFLDPNGVTIGTKKGNTILLRGAKILEEHCVIKTEDDQIILTLSSPGAEVFVNGKKVEDKIDLHTNDRIIMGSQTAFRFVNPKEPAPETDNVIIDWEFAQQEIRKEEEAMREKIRAMNEEFEAERKRREQELAAQIEELEQRRRAMEAEIAKLEADEEQKRQLQSAVDETLKKVNQEREEITKAGAEENKNLTSMMENMNSMSIAIENANEMSKELGKNVHYSHKIVIKDKVPVSYVELRDRKHDSVSKMMFDEFEDRVMAMTAHYDDVMENGDKARILAPHEDPFYHLVRLIGEATVSANELASGALKDKPVDLFNPLKNRVQGKILLDFESNIALHEGGFAGKDISFTFHIRSLDSVHRKLREKTFVTYETMFDQEQVTTDVVTHKGDSTLIPYNWQRGYYVPSMLVDDDELYFFADGTITFSVYGYVSDEHKKRASEDAPTSNSPSADLANIDAILRENEEMKRQMAEIAKQQAEKLTQNIGNVSQLHEDLKQVNYSVYNHLVVKVIRAENLPKMDLIGRGDPFAVLRLRKSSAKTQVIMNTSNPVWHEEFQFVLTPDPRDVLYVDIYDWDRHSGDDIIGTAKIPFTTIRENQRNANFVVFYPIEGKKCKGSTILLDLRFTL